LLLLLARVLPRVTGAGPARPALPLLAPWFRVLGDGKRLLLEHAQSLVVLEGAAVRALLPVLLPLLDGTRTVDDLAARLGPAARPAIEAAVDLLHEHGVIVDGPDAPAGDRAPARAAAEAYGLSPAVAAERLHSATVGVAGTGPLRPDVVRLLVAAGVRDVRRLGWRGRGHADLTVVVPAADEVERLPRWNRTALRRDSPFLLVRPWDGRTVEVGPLVLPRQTGCHACLLLRRAGASAYPEDFAELESAPIAALGGAAVSALAAAVVVEVALRWLVGRDRAVPGIVHTIELRPRLRLREHTVLRVPRCPACSNVERAAPPLPWHAAA